MFMVIVMAVIAVMVVVTMMAMLCYLITHMDGLRRLEAQPGLQQGCIGV